MAISITMKMKMQTLNLQQAADFLKIHPVTLQVKAKSGEIPGAKPGNGWVFIDEDLVEYLRSTYNQPGKRMQASENASCSLREKKSGITNLLSLEKQYTNLLTPGIKPKPKR
jgi:excisionase family DNA binding protein